MTETQKQKFPIVAKTIKSLERSKKFWETEWGQLAELHQLLACHAALNEIHHDYSLHGEFDLPGLMEKAKAALEGNL